MTKRAGKKKRVHVTVGPVGTTAETNDSAATAAGPDSQSGSAPGTLPDQHQLTPMQSLSDSLEESVYWPELAQAERERAIASGLGDAVKKVADWRLELRAVKEDWPIAPDLRARMVYEASKAMLNPKLSAKERLLAIRLLQGMDLANRTKGGGLPEQLAAPGVNVQVNVANVVPEKTASVQDIVKELLEMPEVVDAIDFYPHKNATEDYAS